MNKKYNNTTFVQPAIRPFFRGSAKLGGQAKGKKEELFPLASQRKKEEGPPNRRLNIFLRNSSTSISLKLQNNLR